MTNPSSFDAMHTIRNIGLIAHVDAGKTTVTEEMLFYSGQTHHIGDIDEGNTVMDYLEEERERGITIVAAAASLPWKDHLIHLIDTPGHIDFTAEVERSLRVIDGAVVIFSAVEGVEPQSEKVWHQADHYHVPKIAFINKLDRLGASFSRTIEQMRESFTTPILPIQLPISYEENFNSLLDLVHEQIIHFESNNNQDNFSYEPVPQELQNQLADAREDLIAALSELDETLADHYLNSERITAEQMLTSLRKLTIAREIVPVLAGAAKRRMGIQPLMDTITQLLPSPAETPVVSYDLENQPKPDTEPDSAAPFAGLIFKLQASANRELLYLRSYQGTLKQGDRLLNSRTGATIRVRRLLRLYANRITPIDACGPGDIVGITGADDTFTGDTLCDAQMPCCFEPINFPSPVITMAVEPRHHHDYEKLHDAIRLLCKEDPTLTTKSDEETGQFLLNGMGELHLEINLKRLKDEFKVDLRFGEPRVSFREMPTKMLSGCYEFNNTYGDRNLWGKITLEINHRDEKHPENIWQITPDALDNLPQKWHQLAKTALKNAVLTGGLDGDPLIRTEVTIHAIELKSDQNPEDSLTPAIAHGFDQILRETGTIRMEPLMLLEVTAPEPQIGDLSHYLSSRQAIILKVVNIEQLARLHCEVPLSAMFGFSKDLPKLTGGRGSFSMSPCGYRPVTCPSNY